MGKTDHQELQRFLQLAGIVCESRLFTSSQVVKLPPEVVAKAEELYQRVAGNCDAIGDTAVIDGYWIETHTIGCRREADDPEDDVWDRHSAIYDEYAGDGKSIVAGDVSDGVFVTVTPPS